MIRLFVFSSCFLSFLFCFFFFLSIPPPPISTLFPYTTLFRSYSNQVSTEVQYFSMGPESLAANTNSAQLSLGWRQDRKSTRLNSSHRCISYAVFCLKKKKKITIYTY